MAHLLEKETLEQEEFEAFFSPEAEGEDKKPRPGLKVGGARKSKLVKRIIPQLGGAVV